MPIIGKSTVLGAALLAGIVIAANADPLSRPGTKTAGMTVNGMGGAGPIGSPSRRATRSRVFRRPMRRRRQTA